MPRSKVAMAIGGRFIARDACGYVESSEIPKKDDTGSISSLFYVHTNLLFVGLTIYLYIYMYIHTYATIYYHILPCITLTTCVPSLKKTSCMQALERPL